MRISDWSSDVCSSDLMRDNVYQELTRTVHFTNRSGVRATCPDCHVPHDWTDKIARKMQASKEVWGTIFGTIDTRQEFLAHHLALAQHQWARLKRNEPPDWHKCTRPVTMDFSAHTPPPAQSPHQHQAPGERTSLPAPTA